MQGAFGPYDAALVNGTAAHGEDYDDTFEGGPVHAGAVIVPAVLAVAEHRWPVGADVRARHRGRHRNDVPHEPRGARKRCTKRASIRPRCSARRRGSGSGRRRARPAAGEDRPRDRHRRQHGLGHHRISRRRQLDQANARRAAAAQSGIARRCWREAGFTGPRTVLEGEHGFLQGFAASKAPDFTPMLDGVGARWVLETHRVQALCLRNDDPALHRLRASARRAGVKPDDIVEHRSATSARASCTACGSRSR